MPTIESLIARVEPQEPQTVHLGVHCLSGAGRVDYHGRTYDPTGAVPALAEALATFIAD